MKLLALPAGHWKGAVLLAGLLAGLVLSQLWTKAFTIAPAGKTALVSSAGSGPVVMASGQVLNPGIHELASGSVMNDLIRRAGPSFNLALIPEDIQKLPLTSGQEVFFSRELPNGLLVKPLSGKARMVFFIPININSATVSDLEALPHVGKETAQKIVRSRELHGPFISVNDMARVSGLGPKTLEKVRGLVVAGASEPGR